MNEEMKKLLSEMEERMNDRLDVVQRKFDAQGKELNKLELEIESLKYDIRNVNNNSCGLP